MKNWCWISIIFFLMTLSLTACATRIGNQGDVHKIVFEIDKTTKSEVADALGLPASIKKDKEKGIELWGYKNSPALTAIDVALPKYSQGSITTTNHRDYNVRDKQAEGILAVYTFNKEGVLINADLTKPEKE